MLHIEASSPSDDNVTNQELGQRVMLILYATQVRPIISQINFVKYSYTSGIMH